MISAFGTEVSIPAMCNMFPRHGATKTQPAVFLEANPLALAKSVQTGLNSKFPVPPLLYSRHVVVEPERSAGTLVVGRISFHQRNQGMFGLVLLEARIE